MMENEQEDILAEIKQLERKLSWKEEKLQEIIYTQLVMLIPYLIAVASLPYLIIWAADNSLVFVLMAVIGILILVPMSNISRDRRILQFDILNDLASLAKLGLRKLSDQSVLPVTNRVETRLLNARTKLHKLRRVSVIVKPILVVIAGIFILKFDSSSDIPEFIWESLMGIVLFVAGLMLWLILFVHQWFTEQIVQTLEAGLSDIRLRNLRSK